MRNPQPGGELSQSKPETKQPSYRDKEGVLLNVLEWGRLRKSTSYCTVAETLVDGQLVRTFWEGIDGEVGAGCMWTTGVGTGDSLTTVWEGRWPVTDGEATAAHALAVKDLHLKPEDRRFNSLGHPVIPCINCRRWTFDNNAGTCCVPCGYKSQADGSDTEHQWLCGKNHELKRYFPKELLVGAAVCPGCGAAGVRRGQRWHGDEEALLCPDVSCSWRQPTRGSTT